MVVDRFSDELEVWKLDQSGLRGHFKLVGLVPALANMRGYHLKQGTLAIVTATGETAYHDLSGEAPVHLRTLSHAAGPIGYLDKTPETLVLCHGSSVRCYDPVSAVERGSFPPPAGTPLMHYHVRRPAAIVPPARLAEVEVTETGIRPFVENPLDPAVFDGDGGEWQACHVNGPYLVALSKKSRLFVCTDYEAVLAADDPAERSRVIERSCSVFDIDRLPNGEDEDADGTNWLSVLDGRAAFGARCVGFVKRRKPARRHRLDDTTLTPCPCRDPCLSQRPPPSAVAPSAETQLVRAQPANPPRAGLPDGPRRPAVVHPARRRRRLLHGARLYAQGRRRRLERGSASAGGRPRHRRRGRRDRRRLGGYGPRRLDDEPVLANVEQVLESRASGQSESTAQFELGSPSDATRGQQISLRARRTATSTAASSRLVLRSPLVKEPSQAARSWVGSDGAAGGSQHLHLPFAIVLTALAAASPCSTAA